MVANKIRGKKTTKQGPYIKYNKIELPQDENSSELAGRKKNTILWLT